VGLGGVMQSDGRGLGPRRGSAPLHKSLAALGMTTGRGATLSPAHVSSFIFDPSRYPAGPGCYLMRDRDGAVLYVGKAKSLRKRLGSHFQMQRRRRFLGGVADVEVILVNNETEALLLEHNLIKHHRPPENRALIEDDEGYFYVALTDEPLPRLAQYRKNRVNKELLRGGVETSVARYFGPYVSRRYRDALLGFASDHFRLRTCAPLAKEVCLRFHLGACGGICAGHVSATEYAGAVAGAVAFLDRGHADLIRALRREMAEHAAATRFERAAWIKRHVELLEGALERQVVELDVGHDHDVVHFVDGSALVMYVRRGAVLGVERFAVSDPEGFLRERYRTGAPRQLIVAGALDAVGLGRELSAANGHRVRVTVPRRAHPLLRLCALNHAYRLAVAEQVQVDLAIRLLASGR
jgi:excinuclease ABC subunit C